MDAFCGVRVLFWNFFFFRWSEEVLEVIGFGWFTLTLVWVGIEVCFVEMGGWRERCCEWF